VRAGVLAQELVDLDADREDDRGCVEVRGADEEDDQGAARGLEIREAPNVPAEERRLTRRRRGCQRQLAAQRPVGRPVARVKIAAGA
jgi:hypothetical protein